MKTLIDYQIKSLHLENNDQTRKATANNCTLTDGPGKIPNAGTFPKAINFNTKGSVRVKLSKSECDLSRFHFRVVFKISKKITSRENIFETSSLPLAIFATPDDKSSNFNLKATVRTKNYGWSGFDTNFETALNINTWYVLDVVYDIDTIGVYINNTIIGVHSFPVGTLSPLNGNHAYIGTAVNGSSYQFRGEIAYILLENDIPAKLEVQLDNRRDSPQWHISNKHEAKKADFNLGKKKSKVERNSTSKSFIQEFANGVILYNYLHGAYEMHGDIKSKFLSLSRTQKNQLGILVSDEIDGKRRGSRKNQFSNGAIYWSSSTGAHPVFGQMYIDYEDLGEGSHTIGLPKHSSKSIQGGRYQEFEQGRMYFKPGLQKAFEVHGDILKKYIKLGGHTKWGFPISDEEDVKKGTRIIGKSSDFENCTIYWSAATGAWEVHGSIRKKYDDEGGASGQLGFPTSDEEFIPNENGARYNTFKNGTITWFRNWKNTYVSYPYQLHIDRVIVRDADNDTFFGNDDSDIYAYISIEENGHEIHKSRKPNRGDYQNKTEQSLNYSVPKIIVPNNANQKITFKFQAWDADGAFRGNDDNLGLYTKELNIGNAWGLRDGLLYNGASGSDGLRLDWSIKPQIPQNDLPDRSYYFWGKPNKRTETISWNQYADAFRDVNRDPNFYDHVSLKSLFFELVIESIASGGNCFGMSLEGIYGNKCLSRFSKPLNQYNWNQLEKEFNIKHQYQAGSSAIWWFVSQFISGNTHNPKRVFEESKACYSNGDNPVICIAQNQDFSGAPHCIYPSKWEKTASKWKIYCFDPNVVSKECIIEINPSTNSFSYKNGRLYEGGEWTGGRLHYMPWRQLNREPRTPIWDIILLFLAGTVILFGDDGQTEELTDISGKNLDGGIMKQSEIGRRNKMFVPFQGLNSNVHNNVYFQKGMSLNNSFTHKIKGKQNNSFRYAIKNSTSEFSINTSIKKNDTEIYDFKHLGNEKNEISIINSNDKLYDIEFSQPTGIDGEVIRYLFERVPKHNISNLKMSMKPSTNGIDILTNRESDSLVKIELYGKNKKLKLSRNYNVPIKKGLRIRPISVFNQGILKVGQIDTLRGNFNDIKLINPN